MNGAAMERQVLEVELTAQQRVSLDDVLAAGAVEPAHEPERARSRPAALGVSVGTLIGVDARGRALVDLGRGSQSPAAARSTVPLGEKLVGREVVVMLEQGDPAKPIVVGVIQPPPSARPATVPEASSPTAGLEAKLDGQRLVLSAEREVVLRCGPASITLTRAGKVLIRGAYVLSRSSGVNRIKGGSVQIN
jgi:hypothetical protein